MQADPWAGWNTWARTIADHRIKALADKPLEKLAGEIGGDVGKLEKRIRELETRLEKSEQAAIELLLEAEKRVAELEQRAVTRPPTRPRLVGGDGAA